MYKFFVGLKLTSSLKEFFSSPRSIKIRMNVLLDDEEMAFEFIQYFSLTFLYKHFFPV